MIQQPTKSIGTQQNETAWDHPAFGQVTVSRGTGQVSLYGSELEHGHFIQVRVARSTKYRSLSRDWFHGRKAVVEFAMSEAQWAALVSSIGLGDGVPVTLTQVEGVQMPGLPRPPKLGSNFSEDVKDMVVSLVDQLRDIAGDLNEGAAPAKKTRAMGSRLLGIAGTLEVNLGFVADSFVKHMESVVSSAKAEVSAYLQSSKSGVRVVSKRPPEELLSSTAAAAFLLTSEGKKVDHE